MVSTLTRTAQNRGRRDLYYGTDLIDTFDAAVIAKKDNGKVKIYKKHEQPTRHGGWTGAGWGLATGLGIALFPAAASNVADKVAAAITNADDVMQKQAQIDADDLNAELDEAKKDADSDSTSS